MSDPAHPPAGGGGKKFDAAEKFKMLLFAVIALSILPGLFADALDQFGLGFRSFVRQIRMALPDVTEIKYSATGLAAWIGGSLVFGAVFFWFLRTYILPQKGGGHDAHAHPAPHAEKPKADKPKDDKPKDGDKSKEAGSDKPKDAPH